MCSQGHAGREEGAVRASQHCRNQPCAFSYPPTRNTGGLKVALSDSQSPFLLLTPPFTAQQPCCLECTRQGDSFKPMRSRLDAGGDGILHCQAFF